MLISESFISFSTLCLCASILNAKNLAKTLGPNSAYLEDLYQVIEVLTWAHKILRFQITQRLFSLTIFSYHVFLYIEIQYLLCVSLDDNVERHKNNRKTII